MKPLRSPVLRNRQVAEGEQLWPTAQGVARQCCWPGASDCRPRQYGATSNGATSLIQPPFVVPSRLHQKRYVAHFLYSGHSVSTMSLSPSFSGTYSQVQLAANLRTQGTCWLAGRRVQRGQPKAPPLLVSPAAHLAPSPSPSALASALPASLLLPVLVVPPPLLAQHLHRAAGDKGRVLEASWCDTTCTARMPSHSHFAGLVCQHRRNCRGRQKQYRSSGNSAAITGTRPPAACRMPGTRPHARPDLHIILHRLHLAHIELEDVGERDLRQTQVGVRWVGNRLG